MVWRVAEQLQRTPSLKKVKVLHLQQSDEDAEYGEHKQRSKSQANLKGKNEEHLAQELSSF